MNAIIAKHFPDDPANAARAYTALTEIFSSAPAHHQDGGGAEDSARLDALETTTCEHQWIVAKNKDTFTVYLRPRHHATRKTIREAIDVARAQRADKENGDGHD